MSKQVLAAKLEDLLIMDNTRVLCYVVVTQEDNGWYVATDVATSVASQGKTYEESLTNLKEALELYYEDEITIELSENQYE